MMRLSSVGFCLLFLLLPLMTRESSAQSDLCALCSDSKEMACETCSGKGLILEDCQLCESKGKLPCQTCGTTPKKKKGDRLLVVRGTTIPRGRIPCPSKYCSKGKMRWDSGQTFSCKVCRGKGHLKCGDCTGKGVSCHRCKRGKAKFACGDCGGDKVLPCILCATKESARRQLFCRDDLMHKCGLCVDKDAGGLACHGCRGSGRTICTDCIGSAKIVCETCAGSGKVRSKTEDGRSAGSKKCTNCDRKGWRACWTCSEEKSVGSIDCSRCKDGRVGEGCGHCSGGHYRCNACHVGVFLSLESAAKSLENKKLWADALRVLGRAQKSAKAAVKKMEAMPGGGKGIAMGPGSGGIVKPDGTVIKLPTIDMRGLELLPVAEQALKRIERRIAAVKGRLEK